MIQTKHDMHENRNKGYSLVELIICIAIIAIFTGLAFVTVTMINSAKAKDAAVSFESQLADMITKTKSQVCTVNGTQQTTFSRCLKLYQASDGNYYIKSGYYNPNGSGESSSGDVSAQYIFVPGENVNSDKGTSLSSRVVVGYKDETGTEQKIKHDGTLKEVYIVYNKAGRCIEGNGTYRFYKRNGNAIAAVTIQKNGSHQSN